MQVIKRDGRSVDFDRTKIYDAILVAMKSVDNINTRIASRISYEVYKEAKDSMTIDEIQKAVETKLMASSLKDVARAYIEYRELMNDMRQALSNYSEEWKILCDMFFISKCEKHGYCCEEYSCGRFPKKIDD